MTKRKKILIVVVVVAMLLPLLEGLFSISSIWRTSANEPKASEVVKTDFLKVDYEVSDSSETNGLVEWLINYHYDMKSNSDFEEGKFKFKVDGLDTSQHGFVPPENRFVKGVTEQNEPTGWYEEAEFGTEKSGTIKIQAPKNTKMSLSVQMDGRNEMIPNDSEESALSEAQEEVQKNIQFDEKIDILDDAITGPFEMKVSQTVQNDKKSEKLDNSKQDPSQISGNNAEGKNAVIHSAKPEILRNTKGSIVTRGSELMIGEDAFSDNFTIENIKHGSDGTKAVEIDYKIKTYKDDNSPYSPATSADVLKENKVYTLFPKKPNVSKSIGIRFKNADGNKETPTTLKDTKFDLVYDFVGYVNVGTKTTPQLIPVGARVNVSNIVIGRTAKTSGGMPANGDNMPWMEFSNNLYSGVVYGFTKKMELNFQFYVADPTTKSLTNQTIDFGDNTDVNNAQLTFASLNGYGNEQSAIKNEAGAGVTPTGAVANRHEFAGKLTDDGKDDTTGLGTLSSDTKLSYHKTGTPGHTYDAGTYYSSSVYKFDDKVGGVDYQISAVSFPLSGTSNKFKLGTTYGRAWNSFISSAVRPTTHEAPTKTVQPTTNAGFSNRYFNDLDRFDYEQGKDWELPQHKRVPGHDADNASGLATGIAKKENRYVQTGQSHYYFINQDTINMVAGGLISPISYEITDKLPAGVEYESATLYDLKGNTLTDGFSINNNNGSLTFKIQGKAASEINNQSRQAGYYGKDFSIRVKVKVTKAFSWQGETTSNNQNVMYNNAKTKFVYDGNVSFEQDSNKVMTKVQPTYAKLEFNKVTDDEKTALSGAKFGIFAVDSNDEKTGSALAEATSASPNGKVSFNYNLKPGTYVVSEVETPAGYKPHDDFMITVSNDLTITGIPTGNKVVNELLPFNLTLKKIDQDNGNLSGAKFELTGNNVNEAVTSDGNGALIFTTGLKPGTYTLTETEAPEGYNASPDSPWTIEIKKDFTATIKGKNDTTAKELTVGKGNSATAANTITYDTESGAGVIKNNRKPFRLELLKVDGADEALVGAEFKLTKNNSEVETQISVKGGKLVFTSNLEAGTYTLTETKAPEGYSISADSPWTIEIKNDLTATIKTKNGVIKNLSVSLDNDEEYYVIKPSDDDGKLINNLNDFKLKVNKVDNLGRSVKGAVFNLVEENGTYNKTLGENPKLDIFVFEDLNAGKTYTLTEVSPPDKHIGLDKPIRIEIGLDGTAKLIKNDIEEEDLTVTFGNPNIIEINVDNTAEGVLPSTGGKGTRHLMTLSLVVLAIVGGLGAFYVYRNKKGGA